MEKSITIYIATGMNITDKIPPNYKGVYVGTGRMDNMLSDGDGNNIKEKNPYYCELTALYYVWKNEKLSDYVGLTHYRRFFNFTCTDKNTIVDTKERLNDIYDDISVDHILDDIDSYDVVLPTADNMCLSVFEQYANNHNKIDYDIMREIIKLKYPDYLKVFDEVSSNNKLHLYNMFIMKKDIFLDYMNWLFSVLFEAEKKIVIQKDDKYQRRVFGYLAERLLNVYVHANKLSVLEKPVTFLQFDNTDDVRIRRKDWKYIVKNNMFKFVNMMSKMIRRFLAF